MPRWRWLWPAMLLAATAPAQPLRLEPRMRRHATDASTRHLQLRGWQLELRENKAIRSPYHDECLFYTGHVIDEEDSSATVTDCSNQYYGLLQVGKEDFVLQPTQEGAHVLRRRDVFMSERPAMYNLTGDTVTDLDLDFSEDDIMPTTHVHPRSSHYTDVEQFRNIQPVTRPVSGAKSYWLELAIVADHTMVKFHGQERVTHYILALMNIVSAIYSHPSLNTNMTLVINRLFLYEEKDSIIIIGDVKKSLDGVNKWNYKHLMKSKQKGNGGWDATVWLTRASLGGPSGYAPVGGVCTQTRSAAIDRDEGLTSAFVIAHELAHLLGLHHDDEGHCEKVRGSVMSPTVIATLQRYSWSSCSKEQFHKKSEKWWCLHQRSQNDSVVLGGAKEISNYVFTMEEQCRLEFGEGYSVCKDVKVLSKCSTLWCAHRDMPHECRSKREAAPLEGTPCGHKRWCVDGVCEPMPGHNVEKTRKSDKVEKMNWHNEKPHWSEWGAWSHCSADCGYGLRTRVRKCRHKGSLLKSACDGAESQMATCWAGKACAAMRDIRSDLCSRQNSRFIPHIHPNETKHCETWCVNYEGGTPSYYGTLPDSSPCTYDRPYDICYQGTCVKGQCNTSDTNCNWCPDGYCNNNTHVYMRQLLPGKGWQRLIMIPHDSHQMSVHIVTPVALHIALRERKHDKPMLELSKHSRRIEIDNKQNDYLKYDPNVPQNLQIIQVDGQVIDINEGVWRGEGGAAAAGTLLSWTQTETDIHITSSSRLQTDLMIMGLPVEQYETPVPVEVHVNYSTPATAGRVRPLEYRWSTERGPCSATCGGGVRQVRPRCVRNQPCPRLRYEHCNIHSCKFKWSADEWEECSATCGQDGVQERQLFCVPTDISTTSRRELIKHSVSPSLCPPTKPEKHRACNRWPCPVYWREMPWTPCSASCGRGISVRPLVCPASEEYLCGERPRERRRRCRLRRCPSPLRLTAPCPPADTAQYCELFHIDDLKRNCAVPPFRKYCCNTCKDVDRRYGWELG